MEMLIELEKVKDENDPIRGFDYVFTKGFVRVVYSQDQMNGLITIIQEIVDKWAIFGDHFIKYEMWIGRQHIRMVENVVTFFKRTDDQIDQGISFHLDDIHDFQTLIISTQQ